MSLFDEFALEEALRIRERHGGRVKVITLGTGKATEALRTGIAMGPTRPFSSTTKPFSTGTATTSLP